PTSCVLFSACARSPTLEAKTRSSWSTERWSESAMKDNRGSWNGALIGALLSLAATGGPTAAPHTVPSLADEKIVIGNFTFEPLALTVPVGTTLMWLNQDDAPHVVIGIDPESPIKSQPLDTGDRYSVTLTKRGTYRYFCSLHPHMTGTVVVE